MTTTATPRARYAPGRFRKTAILSTSARMLVSRFSYGVTPTLAEEVVAAGGARAWWEAQVKSAYNGDDPDACDWWPNQHFDAATIWSRQQQQIEGAWEVMADYSRRLMVRRIRSKRQVLEVMTEFWEGHLHVPCSGDAQAFWRTSYGDVIRRHALGSFSQMLQEAIVHPAMQLFLNGANSTKAHPNENLGRELLELHTVGVGNYTEDDVKNSARLLTGFTIDAWKTWTAGYATKNHATGPIRVMGFNDLNADPDGRAALTRYLDYLAHHLATAKRIATKLATKFVSDTPSAGLVTALAAAYLANDTQILPVLRVLIRHPEFLGSSGRKTRDPAEDVVASYRVLGVDVAPPQADDSAANAMIWQANDIGLAPMAWPRPDGQPLDNSAWASPARALASMKTHWSMAGGWWPAKDATYRTPSQWLPEPSITFRRLVDHLSRTLHGRASDSDLLRICSLATGIAPGEVISADHALIKWGFPRLLGALLDNPHHYER